MRKVAVVGHSLAFGLLGAALAAAGPLPEPVQAPQPARMEVAVRRPETRQERRKRLRQMGLESFSDRFC